MSQYTQWLVKQIRNLPLEQFWFMSSCKKLSQRLTARSPKVRPLLIYWIQSEASWKLSSTFDWLLYAWKNANSLKKVTLLGSLLYGKENIEIIFSFILGSTSGAVVSALVSHQRGPGSNPGVDAICGLSLLLVLSLSPRGFLLALRFSPLLENQHFQIPIRSGTHGHVSTRKCCVGTCKQITITKP